MKRLASVTLLMCMFAVTLHASAQDAAPVGGDPHAGMEGAPALDRKPLTSAEASKSVAVGSILVRVVDGHEHPVAGAAVELGTMAQETGRTHIAARTDASGVATFSGLATGDKQAYRVNVMNDGAKYSCTPFRLPTDSGYEVVIRRLDTTHDSRSVVLYVGATSVEIKDERLKIVQQARLFNVGQATYVFPADGLFVPLPKGAMAFQGEELMTDQKLSVDEGKGFRVKGSMAPGEVTLTWGFDLPRDGATADLSFQIPWPAFAYRVLADAAPGLQVAVDGMPEPQLQADQGRRFYVTEIVRNPGEAPLRVVNIHLRGIPGPGPMRFIATGLALLVLMIGGVIARRPPSAAGVTLKVDHKARKAELLERAKGLQAEHARGEVGAEFHARALADIEEELAALLFEEAKRPR